MTRQSTQRSSGGVLLLVWFCVIPNVGCSESCRRTEPRSPPSAQLEASQADDPSTVSVLKLLTYNVLADPVGASERANAIFEIIRESRADVVALQEVAPWFLTLLSRDPELSSEYQGTRINGRTEAPGGQYILSKLPVRRSVYMVLPGRQRRTVLVALLDVNGRSMAVATTHMESFLEDGPTRAEQLDAIFPLLEGADDALVLGDFNFGDGEAEERRIPASYVDLWRALRPAAPGFTWNIETSPMAREGSFEGEESRRLDRILIRSERWSPSEVRIVGERPISGDGRLFPSDHFGLVGEVRFQRHEEGASLNE